MYEPHQPFRPNLGLALIGFTVLFGLALVGARALQGPEMPSTEVGRTAGNTAPIGGISAPDIEAAQPAAVQGGLFPTHSGPILTPTPDNPHPIPAQRTETEQYIVQPGDSLAGIALRYQVNLEQLVQANQLTDPNYVEVGQILTVPLPAPENRGPSFKIIPDSELVHSPSALGFDVHLVAEFYAGHLANYQEEVDGKVLNGAQIVQRIAEDYSINPRLLLAVLEYQSGWLTRSNPPEATLEYPMRLINPNWKGLYRQLAWAANQLNRGFYLWRVNGAGAWLLADGTVVPVSPLINAGTAGLQNLFAVLSDQAAWLEAVGEDGVFETYNALFGYPFDYALEPLRSSGLEQPLLQLPFEAGAVWSFTGGPHGGWGDGSAWAALDFAPPGDALGCVESDAWVTAVADGPVVRTGDGVVVQDLDIPAGTADGLEQTGWTILYMHIESRQRVEVGDYLRAGERVGHPSCEGGISNGTHVHIARRYNGEWIPADQTDLPFVLDGWISSGAGKEYDGYLRLGEQAIEAYEGRSEMNQIQR